MDKIFRFYKTINSNSELEFLIVDLYISYFQYLKSERIEYSYTFEDNFFKILKGNDKPLFKSYEEILKEYIDEENNRLKDFLSKTSLSVEIDNENFINRLEREFQKLINDNYLFYNEYPFIYESLNKIISYVNEFLIPIGRDKLCIDASRIIYNQKLDSHKLVRDIFSYLNSNNEQGNLILHKEDYEYLLEKIDYLIIEDKVPSIERKLNPDISLDTISFTFWVLHKELFTTKIIRKSFIETLQLLFINFENQELGSIKKQFGSKTRVTNRKILPQIITNHLPI
ncbi:hypothetical protein SAMN05421738_11219 [Algoriella xinjiangensis]|uniref:Uncharacterized protein n=1 Tax=Algoriella xinjiangensis TaxID=684065 RepID=A0A1I4YVX0_9FLAO|nr:hypothetical protein [Algoriella xinjiangensis]SFN42165.1 hypothetical protein SAMN05421738_11219 [Algoriella xinjiangensis]